MTTKLGAILALIHEANSTRISNAGRRRVERACRTLGLDATQTQAVLHALDYWDEAKG